MNQNLFDKRAVFQVLGGLMKRPEYIDEYNIVDSDFEVETFYRLIFSAIYNLYKQKINVIDCFAIDSLLSRYETQYKIFQNNDGTDYCAQAFDMCEIDNFSYYINKVKKFSFLRYLENQGYNVKNLYDWSINEPVQQEIEIERLDSMSISEMIDKVESDLIIDSKVRFCFDGQSKGQLAGQSLKGLKQSLKEAPEMGVPMQSPLLTTATRGMRLKKLYVRSSSSGGGKSRLALADLCNIAVPYYYDTNDNKWVYRGFSEPSLFISTELEMDEVQTIVLAYVSGVNEGQILEGRYTKEEEERVDKAIEYIEAAPLYIEFIPNFGFETIETIIKKYHRNYGVNYVCFDYIHMSSKLISDSTAETKGMKMREDQVIFLFVDKLKNLCNTLNIFMLTMTQLNGTYKDSPIKDETMLRSAKSLADRIDMGEISLPPTQADIKAIKPILTKMFNMPEPNMVRHIYKLRRGKLSKIRIWQYADLGTCRTQDLFVTNNDYQLIPVTAAEVEYMDKVIEQESVKAEDVVTVEDNEEEEEATVRSSFNW